MSQSTHEEASRCPRCQMPGLEASKNPGDKRSTVYVYTCQNERCSWFETQWIVQVQEDGTVPIRPRGPRGAAKDYPIRSESKLAAGRRIMEDIMLQGQQIEDKDEIPDIRPGRG